MIITNIQDIQKNERKFSYDNNGEPHRNLEEIHKKRAYAVAWQFFLYRVHHVH